MKKILILNDIHLGTSAEHSLHPRMFRQANSQAKETLEKMIPYFKNLSPDLVMHAGDGLQAVGNKTTDTANLSTTIFLIEQIGVPTVHLVGNHELRAFTKDEIKKLYQNQNIDLQFFGIRDLGDIVVMWLDLDVTQDEIAYFSEAQLQLLREIQTKLAQTNKPVIVFSHYSLIPINASGSFYFETSPQKMFYENYAEVMKIFDTMSAKLFVNAHTHLITHQVINNTHFISSPAFSENIAGQNYPENNPGVYSLLEINDSSFVFSSYSGEFCFGKIVGNL